MLLTKCELYVGVSHAYKLSDSYLKVRVDVVVRAVGDMTSPHVGEGDASN